MPRLFFAVIEMMCAARTGIRTKLRAPETIEDCYSLFFLIKTVL